LDRTAARKADIYIANSQSVRQRIKRIYARDAIVVYPPVDTERFTPKPRGERLLVVSRLLPYKRIDVIIKAATKAGIGLDVVGTGPALQELHQLAGPSTKFLGRLDDCDVTALMENCRAFCLPGEEDFGITPVEAQAAGKPIIAFAAGGALETVKQGVSGAFFDRYDIDNVLKAFRECDALTTDPHTIAQLARRFSTEAFRAGISGVIRGALGVRTPA
jgi:glycosyltransferase involved in cell wall biosynthesis